MDIRSWRAQRDRRYNRLWWTVFIVGFVLAVVLVATSEGVNLLPWLISAALLGMILGRRRHHRKQMMSDLFEDAQAKRVAHARAMMAAELADSARRLNEVNDALVELVAEVKKADQRVFADDEPPKG